jgi:hypothetical protein
MQTGGGSKSASEPSIVATRPGRFGIPIAIRRAVETSVSLIAMATMIGRKPILPKDVTE